MFNLLRRNEKGQGMVEYGLILALISLVAISSLSGIGGKVEDIFDKLIDGAQGGEVTYTVTVEGGSGSGEYMPGDIVKVVAEVPEGQQFNSWNTEGIELDDNTQETLEFTMPENDVTLKATTEVVSNDYEWVSSSYGYEATNEEGQGYYKYVGSEKEVTIPHEINGHPMTDYYRMFYMTDVEKVVSDNPNVTSMIEMFEYSRATSLDLSSFDTSNVTSMSGMFKNSKATSIKGLDGFDTSKVTSMSVMFSDSKATSLDLSSFDTSNVMSMFGMFQGSSATSLDLSSFNTSNVTNMVSMFYESSATSLDLNLFDTRNVTDMKGMFCGSKVTSLDLSSFDTKNVWSMGWMFAYTSTESLDLSSFDTGNVTDMTHMFRNTKATSIKGLNKFDTKNVWSMEGMFEESSVTYLDLSSFNTSNVGSDDFFNYFNSHGGFGSMFANAKVSTIDGLNNFDTSKAKDMERMFYDSKVTSLDLSSFDTSSVIYTDDMFEYSLAKTGYARTQADADKFNNSSNKPSYLTFTVK